MIHSCFSPGTEMSRCYIVLINTTISITEKTASRAAADKLPCSRLWLNVELCIWASYCEQSSESWRQTGNSNGWLTPSWSRLLKYMIWLHPEKVPEVTSWNAVIWSYVRCIPHSMTSGPWKLGAYFTPGRRISHHAVK